MPDRVCGFLILIIGLFSSTEFIAVCGAIIVAGGVIAESIRDRGGPING